MINLAGLKYRNVLAENGGPVVRLTTSDFVVEGRRTFLANAYLRPEFFRDTHSRAVYSDAAGSGTHDSPMVARYMAISEALERWAYQAKARSSDGPEYAFDVDPMSNGMAAFPGLWPRQARRKAYYEAVERFCMVAWWEGLLPTRLRPTPWPGVEAAVIWDSPGEVVVILHKRTEDGRHAYGHAASDNFRSACESAVIELARHELVIRAYHFAKSCAVIEAPSDLLERRSVYFASEEGHEAFRHRVRTPCKVPPPVRRMAYDGPIHGPWEKYAYVWRVVFHPVSDRYLSGTDAYFLW